MPSRPSIAHSYKPSPREFLICLLTFKSILLIFCTCIIYLSTNHRQFDFMVTIVRSQ